MQYYFILTNTMSHLYIGCKREDSHNFKEGKIHVKTNSFCIENQDHNPLTP